MRPKHYDRSLDKASFRDLQAQVNEAFREYCELSYKTVYDEFTWEGKYGKGVLEIAEGIKEAVENYAKIDIVWNVGHNEPPTAHVYVNGISTVSFPVKERKWSCLLEVLEKRNEEMRDKLNFS